MLRLFKLKKKKLKAYTSIKTLPILNWREIQDKGDYIFLLKNYEDVDPKKVDAEELAVIWDQIYAEFLDTFGINDDFRAYLELRREIECLELELLTENNRTLNTFLNIKKVELQELTATKEKTRINEADVYIEKFIGHAMDEKTTTVYKYYTYIYALEKSVKKQAATNG